MAVGVGNDELASLMVSVSADLTRYQKEMSKVAGIAAKAAGDSEKVWTAANNNIANSAVRSTQKLGQSVGAVRAEVGNLAAQFQDIATQLQGGGSPFTIAIQQGQQIGAVLQQAGSAGTGLFSVLGKAALSAVSPINLVTIGLITAVGYVVKFATESADSANTADEVWKRHQQTITDIKETYGDLVKGIENVRPGQSIARLTGALTDQISAQAKVLQDAQQSFIDTVGSAFSSSGLRKAFGSGSAFRASPIFNVLKDFSDQMMAFKGGTADAAPSVDKLLQTLTDLAGTVDEKARPAFEEFLKSLRQTSGSADQAQRVLVEMQSQLALLKAAADGTTASQEKFNKALEGMGNIARVQLSDMDQLIQKYREAIAAAQGLEDREAARLQLQQGMQRIHDESLSSIATEAGAADDYLKILKQIESAGGKNIKNPLSSASGPYQFLDSTFIETLKQIPKYAGLSNQELLALKDNVDANDDAMQKFTATNVQGLIQAGVEVNNLNKYMAHFLGQAGAIALIKAPPDTLVSKLLTPGAISSNKSLLGGGITAAQAIRNISNFWDQGRRKVDPTDNEQAVDRENKSIEERIALLQAELTARGALNAVRDEEVFKVTQATELAKLETDIRQGNVTLTDAEIAQRKQQIDQLADYTARLKGFQEQQTATKKKNEDLTRSAEQLDRQFASIFQGAFSGFISDLREGKSAGEAFADVLDKIIDGLINMAIQALFSQDALGGLFKGLGSGLFGLGAAASQGGKVGNMPATRRVSAFAFAGAPRMARGGFVGVRPGEYPTILHRGEVVIPAAAVRRAGMAPYGSGSGGDSTRVDVGDISIATNIHGTGDVRSDSERGKAMGESVLAMVRGELVRQSRPGGLLRASGSGGRVGS